MRFPFARLRIVLAHVGSVLFVFGFVLIVPLVFSVLDGGAKGPDVPLGTYGIPIALSLVLGAACRWLVQKRKVPGKVGTPEAMLICTFGWVAVSAVGAMPFTRALHVSYLDAYFEAMSGFTTTGITMLTGLDGMPRSLLFWRSMTQWIGGLGILTFFLFVVYQGGLSHRLFGAESHKITGRRIAPGVWHTLKALWAIYLLFTVLIAAALYLCGTSLYDAVSHAFTCLSTGGYSPYDASTAYYEQAGYAHHTAIVYVTIIGMWAGGTNFLIHYRLLRGEVRALWDNDEMKAWWTILGLAFVLVAGSRLLSVPGSRPGETVQHSLFQVVSIATTTGFATRDIGGQYFTPLARQVFLVLMLIGGCAGSTGGGIKVARIVILWKLILQQVRKQLRPVGGVELVLVDGRKADPREVYRTAALFFAWILLLMFGAMTTAALSRLGAMQSASGMFSALGNIGPCYISVQQMTMLNPVIKLVYIAGMLAGRLELIPVLLLFSRRSWQ